MTPRDGLAAPASRPVTTLPKPPNVNPFTPAPDQGSCDCDISPEALEPPEDNEPTRSALFREDEPKTVDDQLVLPFKMYSPAAGGRSLASSSGVPPAMSQRVARPRLAMDIPSLTIPDPDTPVFKASSWVSRASTVITPRQRLVTPSSLFGKSTPVHVKKEWSPPSKVGVCQQSGKLPPPAPAKESRRGGDDDRGAGACGVSRFYEDFEVKSELGTGSFGACFRVLKRLDGCHYAVKKLSRKIRGERDRAAVLREVYALSALCTESENPHLVRYFSSWIEDGHLYIQTELCDCSVSDLLPKRKDFSEEELLVFMRHVLLGLRALHSRKLVHLDIKPANILVKNTSTGPTYKVLIQV